MNASYQIFAYTKLEQRVRMIQVIRFFIAVAFLMGALVFQEEGAWRSKVFILFVYTSLSYFLFSSLLIFLYLFKLLDVTKSYTIIQLVFDFLFFTLFLICTAGINSQFKYLYWLLIFYTGLLFDLEGAVLSAVFAGFLFTLMANFHFFIDQIPEIKFLKDLVILEKDVRIESIVTNCSGFVLFGAVSAFIGRLLHKAEFEAFSKLEQVKSLQSKIQESEKFVAMGQMAARIAHEIRNPLTSISASIEMLKADFHVQEKKDQLLQIAAKEISRLNTLIEDFLHFARQEDMPFSQCLLSKTVQETMMLFQNGHPQIAIEFESKIIAEKPIHADEAKISQLFWNVFNNASDAMKDNGIIHVNMDETKKGYYSVYVKDQGIGLPIESKNVFEPFMTTKNKGTGLGLAIVKRIADQHRATIGIENQTGLQGAIFFIHFPIQGMS